MSVSNAAVQDLVERGYEQGFVTEIEADTLPPGLSESTIRALSAKKNEPAFG